MSNINHTIPTCEIDFPDWNLKLSHGLDANYLVSGEVIKIIIDHIKYLEVLIENCPGKSNT